MKLNRATSQQLSVIHRALTYLLSAVLLLGCIASENVAFSATGGESRYWDPAPQPQDVVLPMPCGVSMAFRKVVIPSSGPLDDHAVVLGGDVTSAQSVEHTRADFIAGGFKQTSGERYYLMAKYELSRRQYMSVMDADCAPAKIPLAQPQTGLNWHDAVDFAMRYNLWLLENAPDTLPSDDGVKGFVRLPTEAEWEFAARGGLSVTSSEFREDVFPMTQGLGAHVWYSSPQSANGRVQLIGLLQPNPLGLHDMLGNVDEIVLDPFRLNKLDRLHGQAGGFTVKGGNYLTPSGDIRSSYRQEIPHYQGPVLRRSKTTGMRVAIAAPVLTSRNRIEEVDRAWQQLGRVSENAQQTPDGVQEAADDPILKLDALAKELENKALKKQLRQLADQVRVNIRLRDEQRARAAISALQLGAFLCSQVNQVGQLNAYHQKNSERICAALPERCQAATEKSQHHQAQLAFYQRYYADTIVETVFNFPFAVIEQERGKLDQQLSSGPQTNLVYFANWHYKHLKQHFTTSRVSSHQWALECSRSWNQNGS